MAKYLNGVGLGHLWSEIKSYVTGLGYTTNVGTITGITMNNVSKGTSGVVDLGDIATLSDSNSWIDLNIADENNNSLAVFKDGHFQVKNFNSEDAIQSADGVVNNVAVVSSLPSSPDSHTLYLIIGT